MHAFDFILVLFSFVYAAAMTHVLSAVGASDCGQRARLKVEKKPEVRRRRPEGHFFCLSACGYAPATVNFLCRSREGRHSRD
jgi:hypothetical protein